MTLRNKCGPDARGINNEHGAHVLKRGVAPRIHRADLTQEKRLFKASTRQRNIVPDAHGRIERHKINRKRPAAQTPAERARAPGQEQNVVRLALVGRDRDSGKALTGLGNDPNHGAVLIHRRLTRGQPLGLARADDKKLSARVPAVPDNVRGLERYVVAPSSCQCQPELGVLMAQELALKTESNDAFLIRPGLIPNSWSAAADQPGGPLSQAQNRARGPKRSLAENPDHARGLKRRE